MQVGKNGLRMYQVRVSPRHLSSNDTHTCLLILKMSFLKTELFRDAIYFLVDCLPFSPEEGNRSMGHPLGIYFDEMP